MPYATFIRNWWRKDTNGKLVPNAGGRKSWTGDVYQTEDQARDACREYNNTHNPGKLSRKMEYTSDY